MAQQTQTNVKKVGRGPDSELPASEGQPQEGGKKKRTKKVKVSRAILPDELAVDAKGNSIRNDNGKFTAVPTNWTRKFKSLRDKDFVSEDLYLEFQAYQVEQGIKDEQARIQRLRSEAESIRKIGGSDKQKKTVRKAMKMRANLAEMLKALEAEGIKI